MAEWSGLTYVARVTRSHDRNISLSRRHWLMAALACGYGCSGKGEVVAKLTHGVMALTATAKSLLWMTGPDNGSVFIAPLSGRDPHALVEGLSWPRDLLVLDDHIWIGCRDQLLQMPLVGGRSVRHPAKEALRLAVLRGKDGSRVCWIQADGSLRLLENGKAKELARKAIWPSALASLGDAAYWAAGSPAKLYKTDAAGSTQELAQHSAIYDIVATSDRIFFSTPDAIYQLEPNGSPQVVGDGLLAPTALVASAVSANQEIYFINGTRNNNAAHSLMRLPIASSEASTNNALPRPASLIAKADAPQALAFAAGSLYCASATKRQLWRYSIG